MHTDSVHVKQTDISFPCPMCGVIFEWIKDLEEHVNERHGVRPEVASVYLPTRPSLSPIFSETQQVQSNDGCLNFPCDLCGISCGSQNDLQLHIRNVHTNTQEQDSYLKYIVEQNKQIMEEMFAFKNLICMKLDRMNDEHEKLKENVNALLAYNSQAESTTNEKQVGIASQVEKGLDKLDNASKVLEENQIQISKQINNILLTLKEQPARKDSNPPPVCQPMPQQPRTCHKCDFIIHSDEHLNKHMKVRHGLREKVLWVGDSVNSNCDFKLISDQTRMNIKHVEANTVDNEDKLPGMSFLNVVETELEGSNFTYLVLGGGTAEISNLDTTSAPAEKLPEMKKIVIEASTKLFTIAEAALESNPALKKVIILRRPPRFDPLSCDPLEVKPQLSRLGDAVIFDLWCESSYRDRIFLGDHTIPHNLGVEHSSIFGRPGDRSYDGIHMLGPDGRDTYEKSVLNILLCAGLLKTPPNLKHKVKSKNQELSRAGAAPVLLAPRQARAAEPQYNPLKILRERISSFRESNASSSNFRSSSSTPKPNPKQQQPFPRRSVIMTGGIQGNYSVPVSNSFEILGN